MRFATKIYHPLVDKDDGKFCNEAIAESWKAVNNLSTVVTTVYEMLQVGHGRSFESRTMPTVIWLWIPILAMRCATTALHLRRLPRSGRRSMLVRAFVNKHVGNAVQELTFFPVGFATPHSSRPHLRIQYSTSLQCPQTGIEVHPVQRVQCTGSIPQWELHYAMPNIPTSHPPS